MSRQEFSFSGYEFTGWTFSAPVIELEADNVLNFQRGFTMQETPIFSPVSETSKALQMQEMIVNVDPENTEQLIAYYSGWANANGDPSAIWRATASIYDPMTWSNHTEILTAEAAGLTYIRLGGLVLDGTNWFFYIGDGEDIHIATSSDGTTLTVDPTPILTIDGNGVEDSGNVSLFCALKEGGSWWGIYAVNSASPSSQYRLATSSDGITWTKSDVTILTPGIASDVSGLEWRSFLKVDDKYVICYESYSGTEWSANIAYATDPNESEWAKFGPVLSKNTHSTFATAHVATPGLVKIGTSWKIFFQGSSTTTPQTGNGGPWAMGIATLN